MTHAVDVIASGALAAHLPAGDEAGATRSAGARPGRARIEVAPGSTVADLLDTLGLPPERPLLVILNGAVVVPEARAEHTLADGDALSLAAPIRAG